MKRYFYLGLILVMCLIPFTIEARSYHLLDLQMEAQVGADGVVRVTEEHTVRFVGTYSGMFQWFDTSRGVELQNIVVSEKGIPYTRIEGDSPGPAGTYFIQTKKNQIYVDWSFEATDETRVFQLSYTLDNVILKHDDVAEFYYQFVGKEWEEPRDHVRIVLTLPSGAKQEEVGAWGYGPLHGQVQIISPTEIEWEVNGLPARTFVEGRAVFPNRLVPGASRTTNQLGLPKILAEETKRGEQLEALKTRKNLDPYFAMVIVALSYLLISYIWNNYGKPYPGFQEKYYRKLPADYPPAELAILYRQNIESRDLTATLLDLARRGFLKIEEAPNLQGKPKKEQFTYKFVRKEPDPENQATLRLYEQQVLDLLFTVIGAEEVTLEDIQTFAKDYRKEFTAFWDEWAKTIKAEAEQHNFFDANSKKRVLWFFIPSFALFLLAIVPFVLEMFFSGTACIVMGVVMTITVAIAATRRSSTGNLEYTQWRAFRRYLQHFSRVEDTRTVSPGIWESYLPYAVTLGVANKVIKEWSFAFPSLAEQGNLGTNWYICIHGGGFNRLSHMTTNIDRSISTTMIHSGASGGGFSGGGGGGFGGGGGGAR
jgi:uncharacterized membrane protein